MSEGGGRGGGGEEGRGQGNTTALDVKLMSKEHSAP